MQARTPISCSLEYEDDFYKRVDFGKIDYDKDVLVEKVKSGLNSYGLVVVDNISLTPSEYVAFTASFGEPINLPNFLVPAKIEGHPEIARVANFDLSSEEVNPKYSFGFYWHHDGNFWEEGRHHIINLLHSHIVPEEGGMTGFLNTKKAYAALDSTVKEDIADLVIPIDCKNIEDFRNIPEEMWGADVPKGVSHPAVTKNKDYNALYCPFFSGSLVTKSGKEIVHDDLMALLNKPEFLYLHQYTENQIVLWDNNQYMHKAMGGIKGKRLLWRTQARRLLGEW